MFDSLKKLHYGARVFLSRKGGEAQTIDVAGRPTVLLHGGEGPPFVYLHSTLGESFRWLPFHQGFARQFAVYAPLHPGFGGRQEGEMPALSGDRANSAAKPKGAGRRPQAQTRRDDSVGRHAESADSYKACRSQSSATAKRVARCREASGKTGGRGHSILYDKAESAEAE